MAQFTPGSPNHAANGFQRTTHLGGESFPLENRRLRGCGRGSSLRPKVRKEPAKLPALTNLQRGQSRQITVNCDIFGKDPIPSIIISLNINKGPCHAPLREYILPESARENAVCDCRISDKLTGFLLPLGQPN
jgi:hypothetical protein